MISSKITQLYCKIKKALEDLIIYIFLFYFMFLNIVLFKTNIVK